MVQVEHVILFSTLGCEVKQFVICKASVKHSKFNSV